MSSQSTSAAVITKISARRVEVEAVRGNTYSTFSCSLGSNLQSHILPELMDAFESPGLSSFFFGWSCWDPECLWHGQGRQPPGGRIRPGLLVSVCQSMWRCLRQSLAQVSSSSEVLCSSLQQMSNIGPRQEAGTECGGTLSKESSLGWVWLGLFLPFLFWSEDDESFLLNTYCVTGIASGVLQAIPSSALWDRFYYYYP